MRPEDFNIVTLVEELEGTCKTIQEFLPDGMDEDDLTEKDHEYIDQELFLCETCGWWYEISCQGDENGNCDNGCSDIEKDDEEE